MSDYQKIATAIEFIRQQALQQPSLADIAEHVHLSEFHFQRLFSRWAGVSPKRYLQALTLQNAKQKISQQQSLFDTTLDVGLSSQSRLHGHFVKLDAVTPSEYKTAGLGLTLYYGLHPTPFGFAFVALSDKGLNQLDLLDNDDITFGLNKLKQTWPNATLQHDQPKCQQVIERIFYHNSQEHHHKSAVTPLSLWVKGTNFQINIWRALLRIPAGELATYSDIAQTINKPNAVRAVGSAIGANPLAFIIPCHRVLRKDASLGGYRWRETRKQAMLAREEVRATKR
ncbi:6-O-methylguanine DNA methyltransferase [Saccharobesus litoralis]|uniref:methylated-DNA--[protein]-cysteine S-methyltransferase n=1 Tax=Saccharobesus litoralis TaxID=2172099 RepID=A0A2S0VP87_9ALTE|nr:methylated-DNA--[protein]-cysteine S-methyltransferase [Saccharobesus litoralis]AWB66026.1 6-O-methylguanine DNA methyltransferase [Saccharobesus litoralis]